MKGLVVPVCICLFLSTFFHDTVACNQENCIKEDSARWVTFVNDLPDLFEAMPKETDELKKSIYSRVEVDGMPVDPGESIRYWVKDGTFTITIKSTYGLLDHMLFLPKKVLKFICLFPSITNVYYELSCSLDPEDDIVNLAYPVLYGCNALNESEPHSLMFNVPKRCMKSTLAETIEC